MALNRKIAYINLTTGKVSTASIPSETREKYIGGRGLGAYLLYNHLKPGADALSPDNVIIISAGLLAGTPSAATSPLTISAQSPLTGGCYTTSGNSLFTAELRWAGFDHLVITGKSPKPVYLYIHDGKITLKHAHSLKGKSVSETQQLIREELGERNARSLAIGPAGENMVRFAGIFTGPDDKDNGAGIGAVFGSKNLKAVATRGTMPITLASPKESLGYCYSGGASETNTVPTEEAAADLSDYQKLIEALSEKRIDDLYGLGIAETANLMNWVIDLLEQYIITEDETDGLDISWNNTAEILKLVANIAERRGFGNILAEGPRLAAEKIGKNSVSRLPHAEGNDDIGTGNQPPELPAASQGYRRMAAQSLGIDDCSTEPENTTDIETWAKKLLLATGLEMTPQDILTAAERACTIEQLINAKETGASSVETLKKLGIDGEPSHLL